MRRILVSLLMGGFCCLTAAAFEEKATTENDEEIARALRESWSNESSSAGIHENDPDKREAQILEDEEIALKLQKSLSIEDAIPSATAFDLKQTHEPVHAFAVVTASISDFPILDASAYTRIPVANGGDMILKEGTLYHVQKHVVWDHQEGISYRTTFDHIDDIAKNLFLSVENRLPLLHVNEKPNEIADRSNVLWKVTRNREQPRQHHIPTGKAISQWQVKDGFEMFTFRYVQTNEDLYGLVNGSEVVLRSIVLSRNLVRGAQVSGKKGKTTWYNDPSGQGSNGLVPSEAELPAVFRSMFGE